MRGLSGSSVGMSQPGLATEPSLSKNMERSGVMMRDIARRTYLIGSWVMLALIIVQFVAAGAGLFSALAQDPSAGNILQYHRAI